jgi:hypothetical protein
VFLVWNRGWKHPAETGSELLVPELDQVILKVRWTFTH